MQRAEEAELKRKERERSARLRKVESWWKQLDGRTFERELAELLKGKGYQVRWTGRPGDDGVDLRLEGMGKTNIVQCKAHRSRLSSATVRELYGALLHHGADEAWLITTAGFQRGTTSFPPASDFEC